MKYLLILYLALCLNISKSEAQKWEIGAGLGLALPTGWLGERSIMGGASNISIKYFVVPQVGVGINTGVNYFPGFRSETYDMIIPFVANVSYNFFEDKKVTPYLNFEIGGYYSQGNVYIKKLIFPPHFPYDPTYPSGVSKEIDPKKSGLSFGLGTGFGLKIALTQRLGLTLETKFVNLFGTKNIEDVTYRLWYNNNFVTTGAGIVFKL